LLAAAAAAAAATSGCAQILGYAQDYYEVPGPASGADGSVGDGPAGNGDGDGDVAREGAPPAEGGSGTFCKTLSPPPTFCTDFDEGVGSPFGWSYAHATMGSTLTLDTSEYESAPASLLAQTPVVMTSPVTVDTAVYKTVSSGQATFGGTLDWWMRVDSVDMAGGFAVLAQIGLTDGAGAGQYYLQLVTSSNGAAPLGLQLAEEFFTQDPSTGMPVDHPVFGVLPFAAWTHFQLSMTVPAAGGSGTATLVVDGTPTPIRIKPTVQNLQPTIGLGVLWASTPSNGWQVAYDSVFFDSTSH
jgi:hypothetical protein